MYVFGSERGGRCWGEWVTGLGLGFTNSRGTWGKWDMCLCFGRLGSLWCYVCVCCESGFSVLKAGPGICI